MNARFRLSALLPFVLCSFSSAYAQTTSGPFLIRVDSGGQSSTVVSGSTIVLSASAVNTPVTATVTFTYRGTTSATVTRLDVTGSADITAVVGSPGVPATLRPGQSISAAITWTPRTSTGAQAVLSLGYTEATASGSAGPPGLLLLNIATGVPDFSLAYILQADANTIPVPEGGTILFPTTASTGTNTAAVLGINRGTAPLQITSITLTPSGPTSEFQLIGTPLLPVNVDPGQAARFSIRYTPRASGEHTATLAIGVQGRTLSYTVKGNATGPLFTYELIDETASTTLLPNTPMTLPDTELGTTRSFVIRVNNRGDGDGVIRQISALGPGFQVTDLPFLPLTVAPGSSFFFTLNFTPVQPGRAVGRVRVENDNFEFSALGLGSRLVYAYNNGSLAVPIQPNGTISFNPVVLGDETATNVTVTNTGTADAIIAGISTTSANEFAIGNVPPLPVVLRPNTSFDFNVTFRPATTGPATSTLRVNNQTFNLLGMGNSPQGLRGYRFGGASGVVDPLQQVPISLTLDAPYPLTINGTLTIGFTSSGFAVDPALQFSTGGRTVSFRIPANTTTAIFPNNAAQIGLQTGTVAGTISITPTFTVAGNFNLAAVSGDLRLTVPPKPPAVLSVEVVSQSATAMTVLVTGYSDTRTLSRLNLKFTPKNGAAVQGADLDFDVGSTAIVWFRNAASQNFGSLFTLSVPITIQGLGPTQLLANVFESVAATMTNEQGTSPAFTAKVQ